MHHPVQQNSNTTYIVSDYGRLGADGKPRELHIDKAVAVTNTVKSDIPYGNVGEIKRVGEDSVRLLSQCDLFTANLLELKREFTIQTNESFMSLVVLMGEATLFYDDNQIKIKKGDSLFIPANFDIKLKGNAQILSSYI